MPDWRGGSDPELRRLLAETSGYLNWGAFGPVSPVVHATTVSDSALLSTGRADALAAVWGRVDEARTDIAALLGSEVDDVTLHAASSPALQHALAGHGYKWLRAGRGTGFARFTPRARERIEPVLSGFTATTAPGLPADELPPPMSSGQAYATSSPDHLAAAVREVRAVGVPVIAGRLAEKVDQVIAIADRHRIPVSSPREESRRAGLVVLTPADAAGVGAVLADAGIAVTMRGDTLRVAPHAGTGEETLGMLDEALADAGKFTSR